MKFSFLEAAENCCPPNVLKAGLRIKWHDAENDTNMFGPIISVSGNKVVAGDAKFGTDEKHTVSRDAISWVGEPQDGKAEMKTIWERKYGKAGPLKVTKVEKVAEAESKEPKSKAKHTLTGSRLDFKNDEDVEEIVLTRMDTHDLAKLICKIAVLEAFTKETKAHEKDKNWRMSQEPEDLIDEKAHVLDTETVAEEADSIASEIASSVKDIVSGTRRGEFNEMIWHYFPDLK